MFLLLAAVDHTPVLVNTDHVIYGYDIRSGGTGLQLTNGHTQPVHQPFELIQRALTAAPRATGLTDLSTAYQLTETGQHIEPGQPDWTEPRGIYPSAPGAWAAIIDNYATLPEDDYEQIAAQYETGTVTLDNGSTWAVTTVTY